MQMFVQFASYWIWLSLFADKMKASRPYKYDYVYGKKLTRLCRSLDNPEYAASRAGIFAAFFGLEFLIPSDTPMGANINLKKVKIKAWNNTFFLNIREHTVIFENGKKF